MTEKTNKKKCLKGMPASLLACLIAFAAVFAMTSCSEKNDATEEFADWQNVNTQFFNAKYASASQASDSTDMFVLKNFSLSSGVPQTVSNSIVVKVLQRGSGTESTLYTDSVLVNYRGWLLRSASYTESSDSELGRVFDQSYTGNLDVETARPVRFLVSRLVDGFTTALMHMHAGDRWKVYIPYTLAYGTKDKTSGSITIPAYSTLVFDIELVASSQAGHALPVVR